MLSQYYPYECAESVFRIDTEKLLARGIRAMIFDIDNTLVHHGDDATPEIEAYFAALRETGMKALLLSNNDAPRCERFIRNMPWLPYVCDADKPDPKGYRRAAELLGVSPAETVVVGDQIFTDILGANRSGMASILVHFIRLPEETHIGKRRYLEYVILFLRRLQKKYCGRLGDILTNERD
jgi:vancomycin resistance protein VanW